MYARLIRIGTSDLDHLLREIDRIDVDIVAEAADHPCEDADAAPDVEDARVSRERLDERPDYAFLALADQLREALVPHDRLLARAGRARPPIGGRIISPIGLDRRPNHPTGYPNGQWQPAFRPSFEPVAHLDRPVFHPHSGQNRRITP
jgi:hypothetical protein